MVAITGLAFGSATASSPIRECGNARLLRDRISIVALMGIWQASRTVFSEGQLASFNALGFVRLPNAVPEGDVRQMYERVWALLEGKGFDRDDRSTWTGPVGKLHELKMGEPAPDDCPSVRIALDAVFEEGRGPAVNWGQPLVTFPKSHEPWLLPASIWHFDHFYARPGQITGVNVFLLVDDVEPEGGGTVAIESSPRLMDRLLDKGRPLEKLSDQNKAFSRSHPWLQGLKAQDKERSVERNRRYMDEGTDIDGIRARVVELTGKAGDVFLCHPALYHAPAPNVSNQPRLMRTQRVHSKAMHDLLRTQGSGA